MKNFNDFVNEATPNDEEHKIAEFLLITIADRIKNNVQIVEHVDKEPELDIKECMKIIKLKK